MDSISRLLPAGLLTGIFLTATVPAKADIHSVDFDSAIASAELLPSATVKQSNSFSDVRDNYWAQPFVDALATNSYISGYSDGSFRPNQLLTRAEFAAMLSKAFVSAPAVKPASAAFKDVSGVAWALPAIDFVESRGFMSGVGRGMFDPTSNISRVQVIVALSSGLRLAPIDDTELFLSANYTDLAQIPTWAYSQTTAATLSEIVINPLPVIMPTQMEPNRAATRAEVAAMVYQALVKENKIAPISAANPATTHIVGF
ncbi:MAG: S-layer homology domain-containing protein [Phormidesmis sp.]